MSFASQRLEWRRSSHGEQSHRSFPESMPGISSNSETLPDRDLIRRWRTYDRSVRRLRQALWMSIVVAMMAMVAATAGSASSLVQAAVLGAAVVVMLTVSQLAVRYPPRLARNAGLVCRDCNRTLDDSTILYALDTGQCWHCQPPVVAEEVASDATVHPRGGLSVNPYQAPAAAGPLTTPAAPPPVAITEVTFGLSLIVGPLAMLVIYQLLAQSEEWCWRQNPPPQSPASAEEEAKYRRQVVRATRRQGWYLLAWMVVVPGFAMTLAWLSAPVQTRLLDRILYYGLIFILVSAAAFWSANKLVRVGPRPLRRWLGGGFDAAKAQVDPESGLLSIQVTFPAHDLSPLPEKRRLTVHWRSEETRPLNVILWRRGEGAIHQQQLPASAGPLAWNDGRCSVPYARAGEDARWSDVKLILALEPSGEFEVDDVVA